MRTPLLILFACASALLAVHFAMGGNNWTAGALVVAAVVFLMASADSPGDNDYGETR